MSPNTPSFVDRLYGLHDLHAARRRVGEWLEMRGRRPETIMTAQLIVSELSTNAFEHGMASVLSVVADDLADGVSISVAHMTTEDFVAVDIERMMPTPDNTRSRGLAIVQALARSVNSDHRGNTFRITAVIDH